MAATRIEHDSLGDVKVPESAKWGAQTQRAVENFRISGLRFDMALIRAIALIKKVAAQTNAELDVIDNSLAGAISYAASEIIDGKHDDQFPIDVFQTGSGTSTNMNVNEVISTIAAERLGSAVHPNDHVNASQSSNDVFPSAIHLAAVQGLVNELVPALRQTAESLRAKEAEFQDVVKAGRTHLMDATPVTLGQEFGGYATALENDVERIEGTLKRASELPLGGTAVGTGINAPRGFAGHVVDGINSATGLHFLEARDHFEAQGAKDALVEVSGVLRVVAVSLYKIANDLRWMSSGPTAGLAEIKLPSLQPGSSIMPGKVNPVIPEAVCQVAAQVIGNDGAIAFSAAAGNFELNVMMPVIARNVLESITLLANASKALVEHCISGIEADVELCRRYAESSPSLATALNAHIGYEEAANVVKQSIAENKTIREVVLERGLLSEADVDKALDVVAMAKGPAAE